MSGSASTARGTRVEIQHLAGRQEGGGLPMNASNGWRLYKWVGKNERRGEIKKPLALSTQNENSFFLAIFYPTFNSVVRSPFIVLFLVCDM